MKRTLSVYRTDDPRMASYDWLAENVTLKAGSEALPCPKAEMPQSILLAYYDWRSMSAAHAYCPSRQVPVGAAVWGTWGNTGVPRVEHATATLSVKNAASALGTHAVIAMCNPKMHLKEDFWLWLESYLVGASALRYPGTWEVFAEHNYPTWPISKTGIQSYDLGLPPCEQNLVCPTLKIADVEYETEDRKAGKVVS